MGLFDSSEIEDLLLSIINFNMTLEASGMLVDILKIQFLCMLVYGEALCQFDTLSDKVGIITSENLRTLFWFWVRNFPC